MLDRVIAFIFIGIGLILYLFLDNYDSDVIPASYFWMAFALISAVLSYFIVRNLQRKEAVEGRIKRLKLEGNTILVDLNACEIVSSRYYKEVPKYKNHRIQSWESGLNPANAVKQEEVNQSRLIYRLDGVEYVSHIIPKDKISIGFWLERQEKTYLYIDREDPLHFYFDLEFLED